MSFPANPDTATLNAWTQSIASSNQQEVRVMIEQILRRFGLRATYNVGPTPATVDGKNRLQISSILPEFPALQNSRPAAATQAQAIISTSSVLRRLILDAGFVAIACLAAQPAITVTLVDSVQGEIWGFTFAAVAGTFFYLPIPGGLTPGNVLNNQYTLTVPAPAATNFAACALHGHEIVP